MSTAIKFENISKQYRLGLVSTSTLSHDLNRWWQMNILQREDPYLKIGETNDRALKGNSDYVWALKDINFEIAQGDIVGIIGKNGAGKSTLLKILSKVTTPSTGTIKAKGRIASLLEVGTGFHPEMTGRENIYMNGAIMGMTKAEINRKFDAIVDFAGVERYIDTPVKRYSSGMTVRLGFAVAAFLEPEILVVDEVLAVGDAEFQKKAIGKMQDVSKGEGRTVLFVSHNMGAIANLCTKAISLNHGTLYEQGDTATVIANYLNKTNQTASTQTDVIFLANNQIEVTNFALYQEQDSAHIYQGWPLKGQFDIASTLSESCQVEFNIEIKHQQGEAITCFGNEFQKFQISLDATSKKRINFTIEEVLLRKGHYFASVYIKISNHTIFAEKYIEEAFRLDIEDPSPLYMADNLRSWKAFPNGQQHGHLGIKINSFSIEDF